MSAVVDRNTKKQFLARGFSLLEILIVLVIVAVLAAIALPSYLSTVERSKAKDGEQLLLQYLADVKRYIVENPEITTVPSGAVVHMIPLSNSFFNPSTLLIARKLTAPSPHAGRWVIIVGVSRIGTTPGATTGFNECGVSGYYLPSSGPYNLQLIDSPCNSGLVFKCDSQDPSICSRLGY